MEILRNMWRRKLRSFLTIFGILVGILAFTVLGAMAEKMNFLIDGGIGYLTGQIEVSSKGQVMAGPMPSDTLEKVKKVRGVKEAQPSITMLFDEIGMASFGMPMMIIGPDLAIPFENKNFPEIVFREGRWIKPEDKGKVVVGVDLASTKKAKLGKEMKIKGEKFKVIGIIEKTLTGPDKMAYINIADARRLFIKNDPFLKGLKKRDPKARELQDLMTSINVSWKDGTNPEKLAKRLEKEVKDVSAPSPKKTKEDFVQFSAIFNLMTFGSALIALIVGGMSVVNTMIMSVTERTREIGIKKAIGAKTRHVLQEYLIEAAMIGFVGGLLGLGAGTLIVNAINNQATGGNEIFLITNRLRIGSIAFATSLGVLAGIYPAWHAARLNPVEALKAD